MGQKSPFEMVSYCNEPRWFIADKNGSVDWLSLAEQSGEDYGYAEFFAYIDALVMGSKTYEQILSFGEWPYAGKQTYVFTGRPLKTDRNDIAFISTGIQDFFKKIKADQTIDRIWLVGGAELVKSFYESGLIDEYIITIIPMELQAGIALPRPILEKENLLEIDSKTYNNEVVQKFYRS